MNTVITYFYLIILDLEMFFLDKNAKPVGES